MIGPGRKHGVWAFLLIAVGLLGLSADPAAADEKQAIEQVLGRSRALMAGEKPAITPGDWVSYRMQVKLPMGQVESLIKVSAPLHVDAEHPLPPDHYWLEFELGDPQGRTESVAVLKMLVHGDPRGPKAIKKMFMQAGQRTPMELGEKWLDQAQSGEPGKGAACLRCEEKACAAKGGQISRGPKKNLYTRTGWLKAEQVTIRFPDSDTVRVYWFCEQVPLFRFAKASLENAIEMELEAYGSGALSRIDETRAVPLPDPEHLEKTLSGVGDGAKDGGGHDH